MFSNEIIKFFVEILIVGGGASGIAYGLFRLFSEKWLENKFAEKLEKLKHEQQRELERHRFKINSLFNRVTKIHEKEFEVLPKAWTKLQDALGIVSSFTSPLQYHPNVRNASPQELEEVLSKTKFSDYEKEKVRDSRDKQSEFEAIQFRYRLQETKEAVNDFHNFLVYNRIFLSKGLFDKFGELDERMKNATKDRELAEFSKRPDKIGEGYQIFGEDILHLVNEIEKLIQERLHFEDAK
jgi:hypothetical protein